MRRMVWRLSMACLVMVGSALGGGLTPELAIQLTGISAVDLSPDGATAVYLLSVPREATDDPGDDYREIWVVGIDPPRSPRRFTPPKSNPSAPRFSPDGRSISFLDQRDGHHAKKQVFSLSLDGGEARGLTKHEEGVGAYRWSPDGQWLAFTAKAPLSEDEQKDRDEGRDWTVVGESERGSKLWLTRVVDGDTRLALDSPLVVWDFVWTPDSGGFVIRASEAPGVDQEMMYTRLYRVSLADNTAEPICETVGKLGAMAVSPDGKRLAYLGAVDIADPLPQTLFVVDLPGGEPRNISGEREASAVDLQWIDADELAVLWNAGEETLLERVEADSGEAKPLTRKGLAIAQFALSADGQRVVASGSTPARPSALFSAKAGEAFTPLTTHNEALLDGLEIAEREAIAWKGADDWPIGGVLTYPLGYQTGQRYPLVVYPHGGPEGVSLLDWNDRAQMLAARGFAVLQPNYRGSGGRGVRFSKGDQNDLGGREFDDILGGIDLLAQRGMIDPERVGIGGWSYGGYLSAWAATKHSARFRAAIMGAGISNWVSFTGMSDIPHEMSLVHWNLWPHDNYEIVWDRSPLSKIANAQTPTLILHGAADDRVPPGQAFEMRQALLHRGVPVQLVLYPRAGHGVRERAHQLDLNTRWLDWFDRYLKSAP